MSDAIRRAAQESRAGYAELRSEISAARAEVDVARAQPMFSAEEKGQLQDVAQSGAMGRQMQEFAEDVRRGDGDWESFIRGQDGRTDLLEGFLTAAQDEFATEAEASMAASEAPEDVEDPRPGRG